MQVKTRTFLRNRCRKIFYHTDLQNQDKFYK